MDVHDCASISKNIELPAGVAFTIEPGILFLCIIFVIPCFRCLYSTELNVSSRISRHWISDRRRCNNKRRRHRSIDRSGTKKFYRNRIFNEPYVKSFCSYACICYFFSTGILRQITIRETQGRPP